MITITQKLPQSNVIKTTLAELNTLRIESKLNSFPNYSHTFMGKVGTLGVGLYMITNTGITSLSFADDMNEVQCGHRFFSWIDHKGNLSETKVRIDYFVDLDISVTRRK